MTEKKYLGRYLLGKTIAHGGMGEVHLVEDPLNDEKLVIKVLKTRENHEPNDISRNLFLNEVKLTAKLRHRNIVQVHDVGDQDGSFFIVMEYIDGETLKERLARKALEPMELIPILRQVGQALEYAHNMCVIHGDLKPGNIMIDRHGKVTIVDFGVARSGGETDLFLNREAGFMGTLDYASPEQKRREILDRRADLYSLGITIHELLSGQRPLLCPASIHLVPSESKTKSYPRCSLPDRDPEFFAFFFQALHPNREQRYQTVDALTQGLEALLGDHPWPENFVFEKRDVYWPDHLEDPNQASSEQAEIEDQIEESESGTSAEDPAKGSFPLLRWAMVPILTLVGFVLGVFIIPWFQAGSREPLGTSKPAVVQEQQRTIEGDVFMDKNPVGYATVALIGTNRKHNDCLLKPDDRGHFRFDNVVGLANPVELAIEVLGYYAETVTLPKDSRVVLRRDQLRKKPILPPVDLVGNITMMGNPPKKAEIQVLESEAKDRLVLDERDAGHFSFKGVRGLRENLRFLVKVNECEARVYEAPYQSDMPIDINLRLDDHCREVGPGPRPWSQYGGPIPIAFLGFRNLADEPGDDWIGSALRRMLSYQVSAGDTFSTITTQDSDLFKKLNKLERGENLDKYDLNRIRETVGAELIVFGTYRSVAGDNEVYLNFCLQETGSAKTHGWKTIQVPAGDGGGIKKLVIDTDKIIRKTLELPLPSPQQQESVEKLFSEEEANRVYGDGLLRLNHFDARGAHALFQRAIEIDESFALGHLGLAQAYSEMGRDAEAAEHAARGFQQLKAALPDGEILTGAWADAQGLYHENSKHWEDAANFYRVLWNASLNSGGINGDYALRLVKVQIAAGQPAKALNSLGLIRAMVERSNKELTPVQKIRLLLEECFALHRIGKYQNQRVTANQALQKINEVEGQGIDASLLRARVQQMICSALVQSGEGGWQKPCDAAILAYEGVEDENNIAKVRNTIAIGYGYQGDLDKALGLFLEVDKKFVALGNQRAHAEQLANISLIYTYQRKLGKARGAGLAAIEAARNIDALQLSAKLAVNGAATFMELNEFGKAEEMYGEALQDYRDLEVEVEVGRTMASLGHLHHKKAVFLNRDGDEAKAREAMSFADHYFREGMKICCSLQERNHLFADNLLRYARLLYDQNRLEPAANVLAMARLTYGLKKKTKEKKAKKKGREKELLMRIEKAFHGKDAQPTWVDELGEGSERKGDELVCQG